MISPHRAFSAVPVIVNRTNASKTVIVCCKSVRSPKGSKRSDDRVQKLHGYSSVSRKDGRCKMIS